jgi:hypothetical protein
MMATRQSLRLRGHGGTLVEEMAVKRKQKQNLDDSSNARHNSFAILNQIDDEALLVTAKELYINLAHNEEGMREQISAIKAEERARTLIAEANYKVHLSNLMHKGGAQDDDILDLTVIDNDCRDLDHPSDSTPRIPDNAFRN